LQPSGIAGRFGAGRALDVDVVAYSIRNHVGSTILFGALGAAFIPLVNAARAARGEEGALRFATGLLNVTVLGMALVVIAGVVIAPVVVRLLAPGLDAESAGEAVRMTRLLLPMLVACGVAAVLRGVLFSFNRFALP